MLKARLWPGQSVFFFFLAMAAVVVTSNILVQYQINFFSLNEILTWGAFTYPVAFLVQ